MGRIFSILIGRFKISSFKTEWQMSNARNKSNTMGNRSILFVDNMFFKSIINNVTFFFTNFIFTDNFVKSRNNILIIFSIFSNFLQFLNVNGCLYSHYNNVDFKGDLTILFNNIGRLSTSIMEFLTSIDAII